MLCTAQSYYSSRPSSTQYSTTSFLSVIWQQHGGRKGLSCLSSGLAACILHRGQKELRWDEEEDRMDSFLSFFVIGKPVRSEGRVASKRRRNIMQMYLVTCNAYDTVYMMMHAHTCGRWWFVSPPCIGKKPPHLKDRVNYRSYVIYASGKKNTFILTCWQSEYILNTVRTCGKKSKFNVN